MTIRPNDESRLAALPGLRAAPDDGWTLDPDFWPSQNLFADFGISRVGDITGLDTIGIPVWFASRPNSRSLSVSQGKGLDHASARLSAIMEAVEASVAEQGEVFVSCAASLTGMERAGLPVVPLPPQLRVDTSRLDPQRERSFVAGMSWLTGERLFAPLELVGLDMRRDEPFDFQAFRVSSIGLGAGASIGQALRHALLELIENDCTAFLELFGKRVMRPVAYVPGPPGDRLDAAIDRLAAAGLTPRFYELSRDIAVPVIGAFVDWPDERGDIRTCVGFAAREDARDAALGAVLEAAQSRLTYIAGARDDLDAAAFVVQPANTRIAEQMAGALPADKTASRSLKRIIDAVFAAGIEDLYVFPLTDADAHVQVVRVLAPDLDAGGPMREGRTSVRSLSVLPLLFGRS